MGLLANIAAAMATGVSSGMVKDAQWGIDEQEQAKKEAADNARLDQQMQRYDKLMASSERMAKEGRDAQADENQKQREWEAEQKRLDREAELARVNASKSGSNSDELRGLRFVDGKITDFDTAIGNLYKAQDSEMDPQKQQVIAGQIDVLRAQRKNFITNPATLSILDSSGSFGKAYKAALFTDGSDNTGQPSQQGQKSPSSQAVTPPQRPAAIPDQENKAQPQSDWGSSKQTTTPIFGGIVRDNGDSGKSYSDLLHGR